MRKITPENSLRGSHTNPFFIIMAMLLTYGALLTGLCIGISCTSGDSKSIEGTQIVR